jgi:hypothetical protein
MSEKERDAAIEAAIEMPKIITMQHEVSGGYGGCSKCGHSYYPYYWGSNRRFYCEDCVKELVKAKKARYGRHGTKITRRKEMEPATVEAPLTREGLFAYFDQMSEQDGTFITTADWLADTAMLIVSHCEKLRCYDAGREAMKREVADALDEIHERADWALNVWKYVDEELRGDRPDDSQAVCECGCAKEFPHLNGKAGCAFCDDCTGYRPKEQEEQDDE